MDAKKEHAADTGSAAREHSDKLLDEALEETFPAKTTTEWMEALSRADILATPVQQYQDILNSEQALANGYLAWVDHPQIGRAERRRRLQTDRLGQASY